MSDRSTFVDSNVLLYLFTSDTHKKTVAQNLLDPGYTISTQVVNENVNVCLRKLKLSKEESFAHGRDLINIFNVVNIFVSTIDIAFSISLKYGFSYWDSLIIGAALENECTTLLSEDMQNGLIIEGKLQIKNPFI